MRRTSTITFFLFLFLLMPIAAFAQTERGAIVGVVTDSAGAVVPGATVTVTNLGNKTVQTVTTNGEGVYEVPFLVPATYEVSATAQGFGKTVNNNVVVSVGQRVSVNLSLEAGNVQSNVLIVDTPQLLQTESATISQVVNNKQLTELPSGDRNIYNFILLNSNVNQPPGGNAVAFRLESGGSFSISGTRPSTATFKIDGLSNTDPTFGTPTITPSLDSVQEFLLQNSAYSAEFEGIGQVNVATKAGADRVHGSIFDFLRNDRLQPRNPIAALDKSGKPGRGKLRFNQFGGTVGGPLWLPRFGEGGPSWNKEGTFFFLSYEGRRHNTVTPAATRVLTAAERAGDFSAALGACLTVGGVQVPLLSPSGLPTGQCVRAGQIFDPATTVANPMFNPALAESATNPRTIRQPFANNQIPINRLDPTAQALINFQQPLPNFSAGTNNFLGPAGAVIENNQTSVRIDHRFSESDSLYGRFAIQNNSRLNQGVLFPNTGAPNFLGKGRVFNSTWTHVFSPTFVNEFRLGYVRGVYGQTVDEVDPTQFGFANTFLQTLPGIVITGNLVNYGGPTASVLQTTQNTYQLADNLSIIRGNHSFKLGFKGDHNRFKNGELGNGANGSATFSGLYTRASSVATSNRENAVADFLLGIAESTSLSTPSIANVRNTPWAAYIQDDWKFSRRITINMGLRYEYHQPYREQLLGGARFDPSNGGRLIVANPEVARLSNTPLVVCCTDARVVEPDKTDFGPRVGIAIQPFKDDPTVIRAGYGIFYADSTQFFHWRAYEPLPSRRYVAPVGDFTTPGGSLTNLFPSSAFTTGLGFIPTFGPVPPAILNNQRFLPNAGNSGALYDYSTPYSQQWSVSLQRELFRNMLLELSYTGSNSKNLPIQWIFSQAFPSPVAVNNSSPDPQANPFLRRPFPNFNIGAFATTNVLQSNYNAATIKLDKRFSNGYSFLANYTWSKSIDQGSEVFALGSTFNIIANNNDINLDRGLSTFDVPHRFVASGIYEFPFGNGKRFWNNSGWLNKFVGGWRTSAVFQLQSGYPFSPNIRNRTAHTGYTLSTERGDLIGDPYWSDEEWQRRLANWEAGIGGNLFLINPASISLNYPPGTFGNIPRNFFRTPFGRNLDFSVAKVTGLGEIARMELRIDVIGATNERLHRFDTQARTVANNALTAATVGSIPIRSLIFGPRVIQLGLKFTF